MVLMHTRLVKSLIKVPEVTGLFWIAKIFTTAFGEASSDFVTTIFNPYIVVPLAGLILLIALWIQLRRSDYQPIIYWFTVAMVAVFGTMVADVVHRQFGVAYGTSTLSFAVILLLIFTSWYKIEGTLSIHHITTRRAELFYWATVMATFALGTAAGDWTADSLGLGYALSGVLFGALLLIPLVGYKMFGLNEVAMFWFAYVITRPFGASFADWFGKPTTINGLGLGDGPTSLILLLALGVSVWYMIANRKERQAERRSV